MPPHCDSLDGPVVRAARLALERRDVDLILPYAPAAAEDEIRKAFTRTELVRKTGGQAAAVADQWFFETCVRLHRAGEGEGFEGLKPAGLDVGPVVPLAEKAIETGDLKPVWKFLADSVHAALHDRFERARTLRDAAHDPHDVAANRAYVSAMLGFIVWSHGLHARLGEAAHGEHAAEGVRSHAH